MADVIVDTVSGNVVFPRSFIYQAKTQPTFVPAPTIPRFFNLTQGDTGLIFQKTLIYQVNTDPIDVPPVFTYLPWSTPTRRIGMPTRLQQNLAWSTFTPTTPPPVTPAVFVQTLADGVIYPRSFIYQSIVRAPFTPPVAPVTDIKYLYPWSTPVRFRRFNTALQPFTSLITPPQPNFVRTINWYQNFSEPVRQKKGLRAWLQQFFDTDHNKPPAAPIFLRMSVTEVNADTASFAINVYTASPVTPQPYSVRVSIEEVQSGSNPWSIEEI